MNDSKLINILRRIDKSEYRKINELVNSPYFNKNQQVVQLFQYLRKLAPEFKLEKLEKANVFKKAFPNKKITPARQNKLMYALRELLEAHLAIQFADKTPYVITNFISEQYTAIGMDDFALKILNDAVNFFHAQPESIEKYILINSHKTNISNLKPFTYTKENIQDIQASISNLDKTYMLQKMYYEITLTILREKYNTKIEQYGMDNLREMYQNTQHDSPLLDTFAAIAQAFKNPLNLTAYYELKQSVFSKIDAFHSIEQSYCFRWLSTFFTYVTRTIESNRAETDTEYLNLYKTGFQKKYLLHSKISAAIFLNPFIVAGVLEDIEWCKYMMANYIDHLHESDKSRVIFFTNVYLNFILENDEKVVELMYNKTIVYHKNSFLQLLKFYLLISLFRLKRIDQLYATIDATRVFLYRQKDMNIEYRNHHLEGLKEYEYFFKIHQDRKKLKELLAKIKASKMPKHWLRKEIEKILVLN